MSTKKKRSKRKGGQPTHDARRAGVKPAKKRPTEPGEAWRHSEVLPDGNMRVRFEYVTHAKASNQLQDAMVGSMYGACRNNDLATFARENPERVVHGKLLTRDGSFLCESWIENGDDLLVLKGRPATLEDQATLELYGEDPEQTEARKAEGRRRLAEALEQQEAAAARDKIVMPTIAETAKLNAPTG